MSKRVMVDMSATLLHPGHVLLLQKAAEIGEVVVALTSDKEIEASKGYLPELNFRQRKLLVKAIRYVSRVVESPWRITEEFLDDHGCELLVHGDDNENFVPIHRTLIFPRTPGVSSSELRLRSAQIHIGHHGSSPAESGQTFKSANSLKPNPTD